MITTLFKTNTKIIINNLKYSSQIEKIRSTFVTIVGTIFLLGAFLISYYIVVYISTLPVIGTLFILRTIALAFLSSFTMLIFSSLIISLSTIYNSSDTEFLFSMPINSTVIFITKWYSSFVQSSWMMIVLLFPFLLAFSIVKSFTLTKFFIMLIATGLLLFISVSIGVLLSIILSYLFPSKKLKDFVVIGIILFTTIGYTLFRFLQPEKLLNPDKFEQLVQYLDFMSKPLAKGLPSWWSAEVVRGLMVRDNSIVLENIFKLCSVSVILFAVIILVAKRMYYSGLFPTRMGEGRREKGKVKNETQTFNLLSVTKSLIVKDIKLFVREPIQWTQFVIVVALILVYVFSIMKLPITYRYVRITVAFFNIGSIMFIITAMVLRFVFVQPSWEYKMFWILKSAPVNLYHVFWSKIKLFLPMILLVGWIMLILSNIVLEVEKSIFVLGFLVITISVFVITLAGYSLGILFPKTEYQNIAQVETSFGGLMFVVLSLCYIVLVITSFAYPVRQYVLGQSVSLKILVFHGFDYVLINLLYLIPTTYYGLKKFVNRFG